MFYNSYVFDHLCGLRLSSYARHCPTCVDLLLKLVIAVHVVLFFVVFLYVTRMNCMVILYAVKWSLMLDLFHLSLESTAVKLTINFNRSLNVVLQSNF